MVKPQTGSDTSRTTEILDLKKWKENPNKADWIPIKPGTAYFPFDYENSVAATINNAVYMFGLANKGTPQISDWTTKDRRAEFLFIFKSVPELHQCRPLSTCQQPLVLKFSLCGFHIYTFLIILDTYPDLGFHVHCSVVVSMRSPRGHLNRMTAFM